MKRFLSVLIIFLSLNVFADQTSYLPSHDSLSKHPIPEWFNDAKFGVMIHYGLYTVPAWAPLNNPMGKVGTKDFFINNPYVAWYLNTMQIKNSPTYLYHLKNYGPNFSYDDFVPLFNEASKKWNPDDWSSLFEKSGVKYVVFVTKHHDGFLLWHSQYRNPYKPNFVADRNIVGELVDSVRKHHMRMGLYYSGGFDWSWTENPTPPITDSISALKKLPESQGYAEYADHQWRELIDKYHPDLIWNDIALPSKISKFNLFAYYYNKVPDGILDNRWSQDLTQFIIGNQPSDAVLSYQLRYDWFDYYTPEYLPQYNYTEHRFEADHGAGYAFAYNKNEYEHPEHFKSLDAMIADLADIVSKNGNLLLAIGPEADGTIPNYQYQLLLGMGDWLNKNGEAIYASRPWTMQEGKALTNNISIPIRFTQSKDQKNLYIILLDNPQKQTIWIPNLLLDKNARVSILNGKNPIDVKWSSVNKNIVFNLGNNTLLDTHPLVIRITPVPATQT